MSLDNFIIGNCERMCPDAEIRLRTKERLLHYLENDPKNGQYSEEFIIKEFSRSAAGHQTPKPRDLRTRKALQQTIEHLLQTILLDRRKPFHDVYDFIFDRLRSVRQDIVIQNFDTTTTIKMLEPIVLFLAYSSYELCAENINNFDPQICRQHLQECLKKLLCCYDQADLDYNSNTSTPRHYQLKNRAFCESVYLMLNLGSVEALARCSQLPKFLRNQTLNLCIQMSFYHSGDNIYKCLKNMGKLPHLLCSLASLQLQQYRRKLLICFSTAYQSKVLTVPAKWLASILMYSNEKDLIADCQYYSMDVSIDHRYIKFNKDKFDASKIIQPRHEDFVDKLYQADGFSITDVLLFR